ncbi:DMT family transporter [Runella sp.]|uniref:DMT family transporter n=1 Tax=Runella sp. TaxID=1960881 RepID=UPI003D1298D1
MNAPQPKPTFVDYLHLHFLVVIWGFTAILGKLINPELSRISLTFFRTLLAAVGLALVLSIWKEWKRISSKDRWAMLGVGAIMGLHWLTFFASAHVSSASVCLAGMSTTSLFTSLLEPLFARRRVRTLEIFLSLLVILGLYLIFRFQVDQALGLGLALISAFLAALFTIANSRFARRHNALLITFYEMNGATLAMSVGLAGVALTNGLTAKEVIPESTDWFWLVILAFVCTVYAYSAATHLLKKISPFTLNLTINMEPVYGMILAYFILDERMTAGFYTGALVILLAVIIYPMLNSRFTK